MEKQLKILLRLWDLFIVIGGAALSYMVYLNLEAFSTLLNLTGVAQ